MSNILVFIFGLMVTYGCQTTELLNFASVSIDEKKSDKKATKSTSSTDIVNGSDITTVFCEKNVPVSTESSNDVGMLQEIVIESLRKKGLYSIKNPQIIIDGKCVLIKGTTFQNTSPTASIK